MGFTELKIGLRPEEKLHSLNSAIEVLTHNTDIALLVLKFFLPQILTTNVVNILYFILVHCKVIRLN